MKDETTNAERRAMTHFIHNTDPEGHGKSFADHPGVLCHAFAVNVCQMPFKVE
jgi:hypothetical protein